VSMWRIFLTLWILFTISAMSFARAATPSKTNPSQTEKIQAKKGTLSAPDWKFAGGDQLVLKGDWQVIWGQLVEPVDFTSKYQGEYFSLPGVWNKVDKPSMDGAYGVATFRLHLQLPAYNRNLAIHMISPNSAWRIYVDDVFVGGNGSVADNIKGFSPHYVSRVFPVTDQDSTLVLQVANFDHAYGGPGHAITISDAVILRKKLDFMSLYYVLVLGVLFAIGLIHLVFYLADRKHREQGPVHLWFSLLCLILVVRISGIIPFTHIYAPEAPYWSDLTLTYLSLYAAPAVYLLFFRAAFPKHFPAATTRVLIGFSLLMAVFVLLTPASIYTHTRNFSIFWNVFVILYACVFTGFALRERQAGAAAILISNLLFLMTAVNDAVIYTDNGNGFDMTPFGILALGLGYSYALLLRLQGTFQEARTTSRALEKLNVSLEKQVRDRTRAFKLAAAKAENHAHERAQFIAAASHDLRQPLHALAMLNAVLKRKTTKPDIAGLVAKQTASIDNLSTLLQDTLDTTRAETGVLLPIKTDVDLLSFFAKIATGYEIQAKNKNIALTFSADDGMIITDTNMLQRILSNLVDNALKSARSQVSVSANKGSSRWTFRIKDDGFGIAQEDISRIFDSYVSLSDEAPNSFGGYGLGLYVVNEFTRALNGTIKIEATSEAGTTFVLDIPSQQKDLSGIKVQVEKPYASSPAPKLKVLAVDDESEVLSAMRLLLTSWGHDVRAAQTAASAQEIMTAGYEPDVLLVDYQLYGMTGLQVIEQLHLQAGREIAALIITGATEPEILLEIQTAGFDMLSKPIKPEKLSAALMATQPAKPIQI